MAQNTVNMTTKNNQPVDNLQNNAQQNNSNTEQKPLLVKIKQDNGTTQAPSKTQAQPQPQPQPAVQQAKPAPPAKGKQAKGQPAPVPAPAPAQQVNTAAPQYDVKVVSKGVESFMVSFNFATTPITQIADYIIISASKHNTSDIHFDPREDGMMVRFRIDGDLQDYTFIPLAYERNLTTRLKLLANMNITESRLPQDGAIKGTFGGTYLDMRVSALPLNEGEKIVIRILDYTRSLQGVDTLGFNEANLIKLKRMMGIPNGIILTTGATGSGKSTTTYSVLQELNKPEVNIITVEDPIEMNIEGINQVQVNAEIGMTFAAALRSILRQDPNVILIGEIRDSETAQIAVRSAITGHLVLSTIHTNNSLATVERLLDMDVERYLLSTAMVGIISQRLAKKLCDGCKITRETTPYEKKVFKTFLNKDINEIPEANPKGCEKCRKGYKGRIAIHEVLEFDDELRSALNNTSLTKEELSKMVYNGKTISLLQDGLGKILDGLTTFGEVYRVIEIETDNPQEDALYGQNLTTSLDKSAEDLPTPNGPLETVHDKVKNENIQAAATNVTAEATSNVASASPVVNEPPKEENTETQQNMEVVENKDENVSNEGNNTENTMDNTTENDTNEVSESTPPLLLGDVFSNTAPDNGTNSDEVKPEGNGENQEIVADVNETGSDVSKATNSMSNMIIETPKDIITSAIPELNLSEDPKGDEFEIPDSLKKDDISEKAPSSFISIELQ